MASHVCSKCADSYESEYIDELCPACQANQAAGHSKVPHGLCNVCGHYGDDCTGTAPRSIAHKYKVTLLVQLLNDDGTIRNETDGIVVTNNATSAKAMAGDNLREMIESLADHERRQVA